MPFIDKNKYKIFSFGKTYYIKDECIEKIKYIDSFREFFWMDRAYALLPLMFVALVIAGVWCAIKKDFKDIEQRAVLIYIILYLIASAILYYKIKKVIKECEE